MNAVPIARVNWADKVNSVGSGKPSRVVIHGVEGVGKTSLPAYAPSPIYMMTRGETGLMTLIDNDRIPETPHFPEVSTWLESLSQIDWLANAEHKFKTLAIDTGNGLERLCHEHIGNVEFGGDMGPKGFLNYGRGYDVSCGEWLKFLALLDRVRERGIQPFLICHTKVKNFKNPEGSDYDRYQPDMNEKTWGLTHKWADFVAFVNYETFVEKDKDSGRKKGAGGQKRIMYTERRAAFDAKNRMGLPPSIVLADSAEDSWKALLEAVKQARNPQ